jgi:hypothetical protein
MEITTSTHTRVHQKYQPTAQPIQGMPHNTTHISFPPQIHNHKAHGQTSTTHGFTLKITQTHHSKPSERTRSLAMVALVQTMRSREGERREKPRGRKKRKAEREREREPRCRRWWWRRRRWLWVANGARARAPASDPIQVRESEIREREKKEGERWERRLKKREGESEGWVKPDPTRIGETLPGSKTGLGCFI